MNDITKSTIINSLKKITGNRLDVNHLTLNSIKSFNYSDRKLFLEISLPVSNGEITEDLKSVIKNAFFADFKDLKEIELKIIPKILSVTSHNDPKKDSILPGVKNTIAIASGKGGVGKSTVAVNIAVALAREGLNVGLIDADIYGPSIPMMMGINGKPQIFQSEKSMKMIPLENYKVKVISIGFLIDESAPVIWRGPMASGAVKQFMSDVEWGELDYLIFDMPPGTGDIQLTLVQTIPLTGAVIVTTPQEVSLIDAKKALKMFTRVNVPVLGVIENMSYFIAPDTGKKYDIFGTGGGSKLARELVAPFLGGIPIDPRVREGSDLGKPLVQEIPDSEHSLIIHQIARNLTEQVNIRNSKPQPKVEILLGEED
jgi:ATP-binding protein involved in chromosome partitioning